MATFRLSRLAEADLVDIGAYTLQNWGEHQAESYIGDLEACCGRLAENPGLGRACEHIRPGLQRFEYREHVVFYRTEEHGILISRILHRRMLPESYVAL